MKLQQEIERMESVSIPNESVKIKVKSRFCSKYFDMNASWHNRIFVSYKWAEALHEDKEECWNAYVLTIGHELTHKDGLLQTIGKFHSFHEFTFLNWCREVYCDFGGCKKMGNFKRKRLIRALNYKINKAKNPTFSNCSHPSYVTRLKYASEYNFDEKLIRLIAEDTKCKSENVIQAAIKFYHPIILQ